MTQELVDIIAANMVGTMIGYLNYCKRVYPNLAPRTLTRNDDNGHEISIFLEMKMVKLGDIEAPSRPNLRITVNGQLVLNMYWPNNVLIDGINLDTPVQIEACDGSWFHEIVGPQIASFEYEANRL